MGDAKQCPWCERWCLKDDGCNYIFSCGLDTSGKFVVGGGCGKSWCWGCGLRFCGQYFDPVTGLRTSGAKDSHDANCCRSVAGFKESDFCSKGCSSHCSRRWS